MNNSPFSHEQDVKPFHSSGYARISQGNTIGSMNTTSFGQRAHIERNRGAVQRYGDSMVGQSYLQQDQKRPSTLQPRTTSRFNPVRSRGESVRSVPRPTFREPPTRYNPFG
jgi:hypothetical protein